MEPNAQGQQPGAENPVQPDQQPAGENQEGASPGVQGRINELTREKYEAKAAAEAAQRAAQDAEARNTLLLQHLAEQAQRGAQPQQVEPELDPEQSKLVAVLEKKFQAERTRMEQQMAQLAKQVGLANISSQVEDPDPRVRQRVRDIAQRAAAQGLLGSLSADDLTWMAKAAILKEDSARSSNKGQPQPGLLTNATPAPRVETPRPQGHPPDLKSWSLAKQEEYWLKATADTVF